MKKILLFGMMVLSMSTQAEILRGGISGGGGGTVIARPASPEMIKEILRDSRLALLMYFNQQTFLQSNSHAALFPANEPSILDVIRKNKLSLVFDGPCRDSAGRAVDGSVFGSEENSICISVKNLSEKLSVEQARTQTLGLVAHEYSHLVGFDEEAAQALQDEMISFFSRFSTDRVQEMLQIVVGQLNWAKVNVHQLSVIRVGYTKEVVCDSMKETLASVRKVLTSRSDERFPLSVYDRADSLRVNEAYMRAQLLVYAKCNAKRSRDILRLLYDTEFDGKLQQPLSHFHSLFGGSFDGRIPDGAVADYIAVGDDSEMENDDVATDVELGRLEDALELVLQKLRGLSTWADQIQP